MQATQATVGVDIGGTATKMALVEGDGNILAETSLSTRNFATAEEFVRGLLRAADEMTAKTGACLRGIGLAAPSINAQGKFDAPANLSWGDVDLIQLLHEQRKLPAAIINDANAAALGELYFGAGQGLHHFLVITLGTGVGGGIVLEGRVWQGAHGLGGEIGHMLIVPEGRRCGCGRCGCLETYISATGMVRTAAELLSRESSDSALRRMLPQEWSAKQICDLARQGDALAQQSVAATARWIGYGMANVAAAFDPEGIILTGGLVAAGDLLLQPAREEYELHLMPVFRGRVQLVASPLPPGRNAVLGAAALIERARAMAVKFVDG